MSVSAKYDELELLLPRDTVTETGLRRAAAAASALYEATWDAAAPGSAAQVYAGHDHTPGGGGGPINRGCLWSACGLTPIADLSFSAKDEQQPILAPSSTSDTAYIHPSPGLRGVSLLSGWICYYARNSDKFRLEMEVNGSLYDLDLPIPSGEKINWQRFVFPIVHPGEWRARNLWIRCGSYDSASVPTVSICSLQLDELPDVLDRNGAPEAESPARTGDTIRSAFPALEETLFDADEFAHAYALRSLYEFGNALYEGIEEKRAPGASSQVCRGHDHDASNYGGRAIAHGGCYTATILDTTYLYRIAWVGASYSGYYAWDLDDGVDRRSAASVGMAVFWVGPGLSSSGSPPTNPPYLTAKLHVRWTAASGVPSFNFRALHIASGNYSAVTSVSAAPSYDAWIEIDKIPCVGNAVNEIQLEVEMTGVSITVDIDLIAFTIYEVPGVGAKTNSALAALASGGS